MIRQESDMYVHFKTNWSISISKTNSVNAQCTSERTHACSSSYIIRNRNFIDIDNLDLDILTQGPPYANG